VKIFNLSREDRAGARASHTVMLQRPACDMRNSVGCGPRTPSRRMDRSTGCAAFEGYPTTPISRRLTKLPSEPTYQHQLATTMWMSRGSARLDLDARFYA
jgi:hypothetical protein